MQAEKLGDEQGRVKVKALLNALMHKEEAIKTD